MRRRLNRPLETAEELATVSPDARMSALLMAWNVALVDSELAPQEEEILRHFAEGMGVSKHDAARAARPPRVMGRVSDGRDDLCAVRILSAAGSSQPGRRTLS